MFEERGPMSMLCDLSSFDSDQTALESILIASQLLGWYIQRQYVTEHWPSWVPENAVFALKAKINLAKAQKCTNNFKRLVANVLSQPLQWWRIVYNPYFFLLPLTAQSNHQVDWAAIMKWGSLSRHEWQCWSLYYPACPEMTDMCNGSCKASQGS